MLPILWSPNSCSVRVGGIVVVVGSSGGTDSGISAFPPSSPVFQLSINVVNECCMKSLRLASCWKWNNLSWERLLLLLWWTMSRRWCHQPHRRHLINNLGLSLVKPHQQPHRHYRGDPRRAYISAVVAQYGFSSTVVGPTGTSSYGVGPVGQPHQGLAKSWSRHRRIRSFGRCQDVSVLGMVRNHPGWF